MMAVRLAVRSNVHDLRTGAALACCYQTPRQFAPVIEQASERDRMRDGGVVEKHRDGLPGAAVRARAVDVSVAHLFPRAVAVAHPRRLAGGEDREANAIL